MKKFNLYNEIIVTDKTLLTDAINTKKTFGIDIYGKIIYAPFSEKDILIYKGTPADITLTNNYQVVEDGQRILIKAFSNWQEIIKFNVLRATYDDSSSDGIGEFLDADLEEIGWNATEFNINYRTIVDFMEKECEGVLLCIEQEDPYHFSGLGYITNSQQAREKLFNFCREKIKDMIQNDPDYKIEDLTDDELEACEFFKLL